MKIMERCSICAIPMKVQKSKGILRITLRKDSLLSKIAYKMCQAVRIGWLLPLPTAFYTCLPVLSE